MNRILTTTLISSSLFLAACGGSNYRDPAPVDSTGAGSGVVVQGYQAPQPIQIQPTYSSPVDELLKVSRHQESQGNLPGAVGSVERAMRIEPRNAYLWNRLANLRMKQGQTLKAAELAAKSSSLAGADTKLKRDNWRLIAKVRRENGDESGARKAEREISLLGRR